MSLRERAKPSQNPLVGITLGQHRVHEIGGGTPDVQLRLL